MTPNTYTMTIGRQWRQDSGWLANQPVFHMSAASRRGICPGKNHLDGTMLIVKEPWILFANSLRNYHILALVILVYQKVIISSDIMDNI